MADVSSKAGPSTAHSTTTDSTPFGLLIGLTLLLLLAFGLKCLLYLSNSTTALRGAVRTATSRLKLRQYQRPPLRGIATEEDECEEVMEERPLSPAAAETEVVEVTTVLGATEESTTPAGGGSSAAVVWDEDRGCATERGRGGGRR